MRDSEELWALAEVKVQNQMAGAANRPSIVVEWLDGGSAFYSLAQGSAHEDETRRLLIIKRKDTEEDGTETGDQHHRTVIPFEVLRGWEVYPRLGPRIEIINDAIHEAMEDGSKRCGVTGPGISSTPDAASVTCQKCLVLMPRLPLR
jgi:hypothetical protein